MRLSFWQGMLLAPSNYGCPDFYASLSPSFELFVREFVLFDRQRLMLIVEAGWFKQWNPLLRVNLFHVCNCLTLLHDVWSQRPLPLLFQFVSSDCDKPGPICVFVVLQQLVFVDSELIIVFI